MSEGKLKTAVLGLDEGGRLLLETASKIDYFEITAVADKDSTLAERVAEEYKCAGYDDYRQLITQNQLDCLLVAAGMYSCEKQVRAAMKKKFNILKLAPAARYFEEAAEFVRLAHDENIKFAVANPARFAQSFLAFRQFLQKGRIEQIFLVSAFCSVGGRIQGAPEGNGLPSAGPHSEMSHKMSTRTQLAWQTDPKLAGGGVLLRNCYEIIDQIIWNFPTPQHIYSLNTNQAADRQQRLYLTEDTAVVTMKFSDMFIGNLIASKAFGPGQEFLKVYGKDKILTVSNKQFTVSDGLGQKSEEWEYDDDERGWYTALLENFALSILSPDENKLYSSGRENLKNMAVIESAYLSARTAMPEEPDRILQMAQIEPTSI
jgi:predicted dehydrogenase